MYRSKICEINHIWQIRDFLVETYKTFPEKGNWLIDRFNFTFSASRILNEVSAVEYCKRIRIWEKDDEIIAIVNTEGENRGEAFFQLRTFDVEEAVLTEMFEFTESNLMLEKDGKKVVFLAINEYAENIIKMAEKRGYAKEDWHEVSSKKDIGEKNEIKLPPGYQIKTANETTPENRANGHAYAFGYNDRKDVVERSVEAQKEMMHMKDYRPELDIQIVDKEGIVVAFANMWYDSANRIGILEPVGTHPEHRKLGLAKAAVYHGENLISELGATHVYVGSNQPFYKQIGFYEVEKDFIYKLEKDA
jgi:N-acetylglutamate synthase-like GNAT family acetyltransferase